MSADSYNPNSSGRSSFFADDFDYSASPFESQATPAFGFPAVVNETPVDASNSGNTGNAGKPRDNQKNTNARKGSNPASSGNSGNSVNPHDSNKPYKGKNKKNAKTNANATSNSNAKGSANTMKNDANNYDFLWEDDKQRRSAKGDAGTTTVVESDTDYLLLPHPDIFNSYPPEVQRKIMEWADRDVRARRDDESLRQDALVRARASRERTAVTVPVAIIILCIVCAAVTGIVTRSALFVIAFLAIALAIILSVYFTKKNDLFAYSTEYEEEGETEEE